MLVEVKLFNKFICYKGPHVSLKIKTFTGKYTKMVREKAPKVREKSGNFISIKLGEPDSNYIITCPQM